MRLASMGDIVMASPVPTAIKKRTPNVQVTWVVHPDYAPLLSDHPDIDRVVTFDVDRWSRNWRRKNIIGLFNQAKEVHRELSSCKFEKAIDLQGKFTTGLIAWLSGAKHRIALGSRGGNSWFMTKTISRTLGDKTQIGAEYRYLVSQLGCTDIDWEMFVPLHKSAEKSAWKKIGDKLNGDRYAVICPFARSEQRQWFDDYWEQLVLRLRGRYKLRTIILGGGKATEKGEKIAKSSGAVIIAEKLSLTETIAILAGASLIIGVDTGLTHVGHALKKPTIALFGATYPYAYVDSAHSKVIYLDRFCSPCRHRPSCNKKYECMREITPDMVWTNIKSLLKNSQNLKHIRTTDKPDPS